MLEDLYPGLGSNPAGAARKIFQRWVNYEKDKQMGFTEEADQMKRLTRRMTACTACALRSNCDSVFYGDQHVRSNLMIVGSHPESEDMEHSQLFYGAAGRVLFETLELVGAVKVLVWDPLTYVLQEDGVFITTAVKCSPASGKHPHVNEIKACQRWLGQQIGIVKPRVIVAMGNTALATLTGRPLTTCRISRERGAMIVAPDKKTFIMPTWDPGYVVHRSEKGGSGGEMARNELLFDLKAAWRAACQVG